ncbi:hypothetical protein EBR21_08035, partial [bacterium]|nr:hypothetical protein [bacterium]
DRRIPEGISLFEVVPGQGEPAKLTFSGAQGKLFCSSISVKCQDKGDSEIPTHAELQGKVEAQKAQMLTIAEQFLGRKIDNFLHRFHWGMRLGFGHNELVVERVSSVLLDSAIRKSTLVASGAHKSGFLFAPCIGELVMQKLQACRGED